MGLPPPNLSSCYEYMASIYTMTVNGGNSIVKHCAKRERLSARRERGHRNELAEGIGIVWGMREA